MEEGRTDGPRGNERVDGTVGCGKGRNGRGEREEREDGGTGEIHRKDE